MPTLHYAPAAARTLHCLERGRRADPGRLRRIRRALDRLAADPRHPGLRTHRYHALPGHLGERVFDSYVDRGAGAWRLFWTWGPAGSTDEHQGDEDGGVVTVLLIGPHP
ncbi:type II toxin-antitoxin system RelE/ParE family toxin [Kitasatospora sp. NPDC092286]|uniref:type II toxin-antitoxin system RelE family toxin n=1 Tax=Kitasatospora sp. NPDC092286 TaxID=3364087 RepID=UPI00380A5412